MNTFNTFNAINMFKNLDADYKIDEKTASFILKWFKFQDKLEHNEKELKNLIENIYNFYEQGVDMEELQNGETTLPDILFELGLIDSDERYKYYLILNRDD